jgi:hypothetical protein
MSHAYKGSGYPVTLSIERKPANFVHSNRETPVFFPAECDTHLFLLFGDGNGQNKSQFNVSRSTFKTPRRRRKGPQKAVQLEAQLSKLGGEVGGGRRGRGSAMKGKKVPAKYRDKAGNTWAGRGVQPVWLREKLKAGAKLEDFAVQRAAAAHKASPRKAKKRRRKK